MFYNSIAGVEPTVTIGGVSCIVSSYSNNQIECETEPRYKGSIEAQVRRFLYLLADCSAPRANYYNPLLLLINTYKLYLKINIVFVSRKIIIK